MSRWEGLQSPTGTKKKEDGRSNFNRLRPNVERQPKTRGKHNAGRSTQFSRVSTKHRQKGGQKGSGGRWDRVARSGESYDAMYTILDTLKQQTSYCEAGRPEFQKEQVWAALLECKSLVLNNPAIPMKEQAELIKVMTRMLRIPEASIQKYAIAALEALTSTINSNVLHGESLQHCMQHLVSYCRCEPTFTFDESHASSLCSLAFLVGSHLNQLAAEDSARELVGGVFLPFLESSQDTIVKYQSAVKSICQALGRFFQAPSHVSAIMAPLVQDVNMDGTEQQISNPLRQRVFRTIQRHLYSPQSSEELKVSLLVTLSKATDSLVRIDGIQSKATDIDLLALQDLLRYVMDDQESILFKPTITLVRSMIRRFPRDMIRLGSSVLIEPVTNPGAVSVGRCSTCSMRATELRPLTRILHSLPTNEKSKDALGRWILATHCLADFVEILPWQKWLQVPLNPQRQYTISGFRRQVVDSLKGVIDASHCAFLHCSKHNVRAIVRLAGAIFDNPPLDQEELRTSSTRLWSDMMLSITGVVDDTILRVTIEGLISSMGGRVTPQGDLLPMCLPGRNWLSTEASYACLSKVQDAVDGVKSDEYIRVLVAIFRTRPQTAASMWGGVHKLILRSCGSTCSSEQKTGFSLLEAITYGRRDFGFENHEEEAFHGFPTLVYDVLRTRTSHDGSNSPIQFDCCNIFGGLLPVDWAILAKQDPAVDFILDNVSSFCSAENFKLRSTACKAIGDFCSHFINQDLITVQAACVKFQQVAKKASLAMLPALVDENGSVRAMALFCLGNLAQSLFAVGDCGLMDSTTWLQLVAGVQQLLQDSNEKVAGNAIRSLGHCGLCLVIASNDTRDREVVETVELIFQKLAVKLENTLALTSDEAKSQMTWKQRSTAKKHGWGACNALGLLFTVFPKSREAIPTSTAGNALAQLVKCFHAFFGLNEKIASSAISALRQVDPLILSELIGKSGGIGEALGTCILRLYEAHAQERFLNRKVQAEAESLLLHLLASASIVDAFVVLNHDEFSSVHLDFLYYFMLQHPVEGRAFDIFALAMQRPGLDYVDATMEQNFASRALRRIKTSELGLTAAVPMDHHGDVDEL